jgi:hypothetical protein
MAPYAIIRLGQPLRQDVEGGAQVLGMSEASSKQAIYGNIATAKKGTTTLYVNYAEDDEHWNAASCSVGGNVEPRTGGCKYKGRRRTCCLNPFSIEPNHPYSFLISIPFSCSVLFVFHIQASLPVVVSFWMATALWTIRTPPVAEINIGAACMALVNTRPKKCSIAKAIAPIRNTKSFTITTVKWIMEPSGSKRL